MNRKIIKERDLLLEDKNYLYTIIEKIFQKFAALKIILENNRSDEQTDSFVQKALKHIEEIENKFLGGEIIIYFNQTNCTLKDKFYDYHYQQLFLTEMLDKRACYSISALLKKFKNILEEKFPLNELWLADMERYVYIRNICFLSDHLVFLLKTLPEVKLVYYVN